MRRHFSTALVLGAAALVGCAQGEFDSTAQTNAGGGDAVRVGTNARVPPDVAVRNYLKSHGLGREGADALRTIRSSRSRKGLTHVRLEQTVGGLRIEGPYVKATVDENGKVVHVIDKAARFTSAVVAPAAINEGPALRAAMSAVHPGEAVDETAVDRDGNTTSFAKGSGFVTEPTVERVAVPGAAGNLEEAFLVTTWTRKGNNLHETLVSGSGTILDVLSRTNRDTYNVFPIDPDKTPQTFVNGPTGQRAWLFAGDHTTNDIAGNNVHAYLDANADNAPDGTGTTVSDGRFLAVFDATVTPSTQTNRDVAVQNLFYLNNVLHDTLYAYGFDEAAGNFQEDNFKLGGRGGDSVNAEAQDGSGTDNANFATPRDGRNPRMQMYLWSGFGDGVVTVSGTDYVAQVAGFGPAPTIAGVSGALILVDDGSTGDGTGSTTDACEALPAGSLAGDVALVDRGTCSFVTKTKNVEDAGAIAIVVANNVNGDSIITMADDGTGTTLNIPAVMVSQKNGALLKGQVGNAANVALADPPPVDRDGDLDSDIVYHEYCHGLTWRMIGRMDGPIAGAIGEGMSDVLAEVLNDDPIMGEYSANDPRGIRSAPYDDYPRTYGDIQGTEVHYDGEVYGAIGWALYVGFNKNKDQVLGYMVDGMNYTPAKPTFEKMRDGILQAAAGSPADQCTIWKAFAKYGVGVGAKAVIRGPNLTITESFAVPASCP